MGLGGRHPADGLVGEAEGAQFRPLAVRDHQRHRRGRRRFVRRAAQGRRGRLPRRQLGRAAPGDSRRSLPSKPIPSASADPGLGTLRLTIPKRITACSRKSIASERCSRAAATSSGSSPGVSASLTAAISTRSRSSSIRRSRATLPRMSESKAAITAQADRPCLTSRETLAPACAPGPPRRRSDPPNSSSCCRPSVAGEGSPVRPHGRRLRRFVPHATRDGALRSTRPPTSSGRVEPPGPPIARRNRAPPAPWRRRARPFRHRSDG